MKTNANDKRGKPCPAVSDGVLALEDFLPYRLSVLANRASDALAREYSQRFALGVTEWRVMAVLGPCPGLTANEVVRRTAMDKVAVSRTLARLQGAGRLQRKPDRSDRRRTLLRLSRAGQAIYAQIVPIALDFERQLLDGMTASDRARVFRLLNRLDELELRTEAVERD